MIRSGKPGWSVRYAGLLPKGSPAPLRFTRDDARDADGAGQADGTGGTGQRAGELQGYAAVFDSVTTLYEWRYNNVIEVFREVVRPGAFARAIREKQDVCGVIEHDWRGIIVRSTAGNCDLSEDGTGLLVRARPPKTTRAMDLIMDVEAGNIQGMSFRFMPKKSRETVDVRTQKVDGQNVQVRTALRELIDVDISDVSWVAWPAYADTSTGVRSASVDNPIIIMPAIAGVPRRSPDCEDVRSLFAQGGELEWGRRAIRKHLVRDLRAKSLALTAACPDRLAR
jgi:uncharacterized protein